MRWLLLVLACCKKPTPIAGEDVSTFIDATADASVDVATDVASDVVDATTEDACVAGETWDAKLEVKKNDLVVTVPRMSASKTIYKNCHLTGGGCGCDKGIDPAYCKITASGASIAILTDDFSTHVDVSERGTSAIVATWDHEVYDPTNPTGHVMKKSTEVLLTLPCPVKIRFVR